MKKQILPQIVMTIIVFLCSFSFSNLLEAQIISQNRSIILSASVQNSPAQIQLNWIYPRNDVVFKVFRKLKTDAGWLSLANLPAGTFQYTDNTVQTGISYEYRVDADVPFSADGFGHINTGIELPLVNDKGTIALVIDDAIITNLSTEINQLKMDLIGDGWKVTEILVDQTDTPPTVKAEIVGKYNSISDLNAVYLLGNVPVPYSGRLAPDGHTNNHLGAWPCDGYYGDMDGTWTDRSI